MRVINTYSFKKGEEYIKKNHPSELREVLKSIRDLDATLCLTKVSAEKTMPGYLLFSPVDLNKYIKLDLHGKGWTGAADGKKGFAEPRHSFGKNRFREMDGLKNKVGLEIQFGKYAFMGYDIFSKMVIFNKLGYIDCGIEIVPCNDLVQEMSTGVSSFDQLMVDFQYRGESDIDIPVYVIGIGLTKEEEGASAEKRELHKVNKKLAEASLGIRKFYGSRPGPK